MGELRGMGLAEHDSAKTFQAGDHGGVFGWFVPFVERRSELTHQPSRVNDVFDAERDSSERACNGFEI